jgi:hypothetical protein
MGSLGTRIVVEATGRVHVTYQKDFCELAGSCPPNPNAPDPYPFRGMGYAYRSGTWTRVGKVQDPALNCVQCVPDHVGGFGALALTSGGLAVVAQHMNEDGCDLRGDFYLQTAAGAASWRGYLTPIAQAPNPSILFPQVTANPNGSFSMLGEDPREGLYDEVDAFRMNYLAAPGTVFTCPLGWQIGNWISVAPAGLFRDGRPAFPSMAVSSNGRVGVAVGDLGGNVYLIESSNGTFGPGTVVTRMITNYSEAAITADDSTSTQYRPYVHCHVAYNDTTPNVVWSELQGRRVGGVLEFHDFRSRIMHWDSNRGARVVKQVALGEADRYDDVDQVLSGPLAGFNTLSVDWPQVGFSADGFETYVAWLRFSDAEVDPTADMGLTGIVTGIGFGDIIASVTRPGEGWSPPQNLTNTPTTDERFFSLAARNSGGRLNLVFQASATNQAGGVVIGDRGTTPGILVRRIAYLSRALGSSLVDVADPGSPFEARTLTAAPNPAGSRIRFSPTVDIAASGAKLEVFAADGRRVARVAAVGDGSFTWDGRDADGRRAPAGVYFARMVEAPIRPVRFVLLP